MCWTGRQALCTDLEVAPREGAHPSRFLGLVGNEGCGEMGWGEREGKGEKDGQGRAGQVKPVTLLARQRLFRMDTLTPVTGGMGGGGRQSLGGLGRHALRLLRVFFLSHSQRPP